MKVSLKKNIFYNIIYTTSNILYPLIVFPYISRIFLSDGMGKINFYTSITNYLIVLASFGIGTYGIREVARYKNNNFKLNKTANDLFNLNFKISLIVSVIFLIISLLVPKLSSEIWLLIFSIFNFILYPLNLNWFYSGIENYRYIMIRSIIIKFVSIILIFLFVNEKTDYNIYMFILLLSNLISSFFNYKNANKFVLLKLDFKIDVETLKLYFNKTKYMYFSILAVNIYTNFDVVILGVLSNNTEVGLYSVASKIKWLILMLVNSASIVLLPKMTLYYNENRNEDINNILKLSLNYLFIIVIPITSFFILKSNESVLLIGGKEFTGAIISMKVMMPIIIISGLSNIIANQIILPNGKYNIFMYAVTFAAIFNIFLNLLLVPLFGALGSALATLFAELTQLCIQLFCVRSIIFKLFDFFLLTKIIISSIFSGYIISYLFIHNKFFNIIISGVVFFTIYILLLVLLKERIIRNIIKNIINKIIGGKKNERNNFGRG